MTTSTANGCPLLKYLSEPVSATYLSCISEVSLFPLGSATSATSPLCRGSWETSNDLDKYRMESAFLERQALLEISHAPDTISFEASFILPKLYSEGLIVNEGADDRTCSSVLFMEKMNGVSFDDFINSIENTNSVKDFVDVTISALNAQFYLSELGDPDEPQIGIFRTDNGVHNLLVSRDDTGLKAICLYYGSCRIPSFTGEVV